MTEIRFDEDVESSVLAGADPAWIELAVGAALCKEGRRGDVCVLLTDLAGIRALNAEYRSIDAATDVLTFPAWEGEALLAPPDGYLGDIAICVPRAEEQAGRFGHSLQREIMFLAVHGTLHLLGYDHMTPADETAMFTLQEEILNEMGITR